MNTVTNKYQVLVIGKMDSGDVKKRSESDEQTTLGEYEQTSNIPIIIKALNHVFNDLDIECEIHDPHDLIGRNIVERVFAKIDDADLAVADISHRSPNVFYEIAFLDALGTPVIMLDKSGNTPPFYFTHDSITLLQEYSEQEIITKTKEQISQHMDPSRDVNLADNIMTNYYEGSSLIDISASAGIAVGFFQNFLKPCLASRTGTLAQRVNNVNKLILIKPNTLRTQDNDKKMLNKILGDDLRHGITLSTPASPRGEVVVSIYKDMIIDFPAPLYSSNNSPRYLKYRRRIENIGNLSLDAREEILARVDKKMIASYFSIINMLTRREQDLNESYEVIDIDDVYKLK